MFTSVKQEKLAKDKQSPLRLSLLLSLFKVKYIFSTLLVNQTFRSFDKKLSHCLKTRTGFTTEAIRQQNLWIRSQSDLTERNLSFGEM